MYAVIDIETTGGSPESGGILEIAVYLHDGQQITGEYTSLVNPGTPIPPFISRLTGITDDMVMDAPPFSAIASEIYELIRDKVFVAHNVQFDYSFLQNSFSMNGLTLESQLFCTCKSARKLIPGFPSYSLGKLCSSLSISLENAHRASADALATTKILEILIDKAGGRLEPFYYLREPRVNVSRIPDDQVDKLPTKQGLLYFMDENGKVIYLIKAKNIRKKAWSVIGKFRNKRFAAVATLATSIAFEITGGHILSSLKEIDEIKNLNPQYNRKFKFIESRYSIYEKLNENGDLILETGLFDLSLTPLLTFNSKPEADRVLRKITAEFELSGKTEKLSVAGNQSHTDEDHAGTDAAVKKLESMRQRFIITENGPEQGSLSMFLIENGAWTGYKCAQQEELGNDISELLDSFKKVEDSPGAFKSIVKHISKGDYKDIIHL